MDNYDFETYLEIDSEIEKLRNIANSCGKNVSADSEGDHQLSVFIDLNKYFRAVIYFKFFILSDQFHWTYYLAFQQRRNADGLYGTIYPKRHIVPRTSSQYRRIPLRPLQNSSKRMCQQCRQRSNSNCYRTNTRTSDNVPQIDSMVLRRTYERDIAGVAYESLFF